MNAVTPVAAHSTVRQFFSELWGADADGKLSGVGVVAALKGKDFHHCYARTIDEASTHIERLCCCGQGVELYFAPALFRDVDFKKNTGNRVKEKAIGAWEFWIDVDVGEKKAAEGKGYATRRLASQALIEFCRATGLPAPSQVVCSGYGLHVYWLMSEFVPADLWRQWASKLKALTVMHEFLVDQTRTDDISSVLRPAGTLNFKNPDDPQPVAVLYPPDGAPPRRCDLAEFEGRLVTAAQACPKATAGALDGLDDMPGNILPLDSPPPPETPEEIERVGAMLAVIPPRVGRAEWRDVVWSIRATGWDCAKQLAREWSEQGGDKWDENDFAGVWSAKPPSDRKPIGFGSLEFIARKHGYNPPSGAGGALTIARIVSPRADQGDVTNAAYFARLNVGRLCHIRETNEWLPFDPVSGWLKPQGGEADRAAKAVLAEMSRHAAANWRANPQDAEALQLVKHVKKSHDLPRIRAMIELAKSEPDMSFSLACFDADPMLLGLGNGVLNLETGALLRMSPDVLVSKRANAAFDPDAGCPSWEEFLRRVQPEQEMRAFLRRLCGYILTGSIRDHIFPVVYGEGGNGKGVFLETFAYVLGDYSAKIGTETLMEYKRSPQAASPDLMRLRGARLAYCSETTDGQRLDSARVKELTGGDTITARPLYGSPVTFTPSHKLMLMGNYKPEVSDMSDGMWRRMILIPFDVKIPNEQQDLRLLEKLKAEASGILNWALAGLRDYSRQGLQVPEQISRATHAYKDENDLLQQWLSDECVVSEKGREQKSTLYFRYEAWGKRNGIPPLSQPRFTRRLGKQFHLKLGPDHRTVHGVGLKEEPEGNL